MNVTGQYVIGQRWQIMEPLVGVHDRVLALLHLLHTCNAVPGAVLSSPQSSTRSHLPMIILLSICCPLPGNCFEHLLPSAVPPVLVLCHAGGQTCTATVIPG